MRNLRTGTPQPVEEWDAEDIMAHLSCDRETAERLMKECRRLHGINGYGTIEKHLMLDFINRKQREEREREARYNADIASVRQVAVLEEQVKALKEQIKAQKEQIATLGKMNDSSSTEARKARTQSLIANFISAISLAIAIIALALK